MMKVHLYVLFRHVENTFMSETEDSLILIINRTNKLNLWLIFFLFNSERTCDTTVPVRKLAFCVLAEKVHIKSFTIAQRIRLLESGLTDQSETVREMCVDALLKAWLKTFEGNTVNLLKALDVENAEEPAKMFLKAVFKGEGISEQGCVTLRVFKCLSFHLHLASSSDAWLFD